MKVERTGMDPVFIMQQLQALESLVAEAGWFPSAVHPNGTPVAGAMAVQEFGSEDGSVPPRSFMRSTVAEMGEQWGKLFQRFADRVMQGKMTPQQAFDAIGLEIEGAFRAKIASIQEPELSKRTLAARRKAGITSTKPLVATRLAINTLTSQVRSK